MLYGISVCTNSIGGCRERTNSVVVVNKTSRHVFKVYVKFCFAEKLLCVVLKLALASLTAMRERLSKNYKSVGALTIYSRDLAGWGDIIMYIAILTYT